MGIPRTGLAPQDKTQLPPPSEQKPNNLALAWIRHSGQDHIQPFLLLSLPSLPTLRTEAGTCHCQGLRNPLSSVFYFPDNPLPTPI